MSLFDRGFAVTSELRIQTAAELRNLLEYTREPEIERRGLDDLLAQLGARIAQPSHSELTQHASLLGATRHLAISHVRTLAAELGLVASQGGGPDDVSGPRPFHLVRLALAPTGVIPAVHVEYKIELAGADDAEVSTEGEVLWRGAARAAEGLREAILPPVVALFLTTYGS